MNRALRGLPALCAVLIIVAASATPAGAQEQPSQGLRVPPRSFALPMEVEHDFGAANGEATIIRFLPLWSLPLSDTWRLINLNMIVLAEAPGGVPGGAVNPNPTPGDRAFGLSDLIHASFLTPENQGKFIWGAGFLLSVPTATSDVLGSGKWAAGPALRLTFRSGPWNVGAVAGQRWSFAGDASRADLNALIIRGSFRFQLPGPWYLVSAPIITANWNAASSQTWLVPLGGGPGITFQVGDHRWAASAQAYVNAIRPDGAPEWAARVQVIPAIPL
jgi:hypothetical protein